MFLSSDLLTRIMASFPDAGERAVNYPVMDLQDISATIEVEMRGFGVVVLGVEYVFESFFFG